MVREWRGLKPVLSPETVEEIVRLTQLEKPAGATHWSYRSMAKQVGVSPATVSGSGPGLAMTGSNEALRSRGASKVTDPPVVNTVFGPWSLRELPLPDRPGSATS